MLANLPIILANIKEQLLAQFYIYFLADILLNKFSLINNIGKTFI